MRAFGPARAWIARPMATRCASIPPAVALPLAQRSFASPAAAAAAGGAAAEDRMSKLVALCKRRGFVYHSADIYNGLRGCYDYGPLGALLKRNLTAAWWHAMVDTRTDVLPLDTSILTHRGVLETSGHVANFSDPLVDCRLSKARFRADKAGPVQVGADGRLVIRAADRPQAEAWCALIAEQLAPGALVERRGPNVVLHVVPPPDPSSALHAAMPASAPGTGPGSAPGSLLLAPAEAGAAPIPLPYRGYANPANNSPFLTAERQFNMMFSTSLGAVDPLDDVVDALAAPPPPPTRAAAIERARQRLEPSLAYLRPETAQGAFVQFSNVVASTGAKLPFGLAQVGKSFRNEITLEHFIFRTAEFEQMELEFFTPPADAADWFQYWRDVRMAWWKALLPRSHARLRFVDHPPTSLAHYSRACTDIEFEYPWGWGELEGIAHRGDYDLRAHAEATGRAMTALDADGRTRVTPHAIEPAAGLNRGLLAVLVDAYDERAPEEPSPSAASSSPPLPPAEAARVVLRLHPALAPIKVAVCPLVKSAGMADAADAISEDLRRHAVSSRLELSTSLSIGRRYARHDEIGTPWCVTVDHQTLQDGTVTLRDRDTMEQRRIAAADVVAVVRDGSALATALPVPRQRPASVPPRRS